MKSIGEFYRQLGLIRVEGNQHNDNQVIYISDSEDDDNANSIDESYDPSEWQWDSEGEAPGLDEIQLFDQQQRDILISVDTVPLPNIRVPHTIEFDDEGHPVICLNDDDEDNDDGAINNAMDWQTDVMGSDLFEDIFATINNDEMLMEVLLSLEDDFPRFF